MRNNTELVSSEILQVNPTNILSVLLKKKNIGWISWGWNFRELRLFFRFLGRVTNCVRMWYLWTFSFTLFPRTLLLRGVKRYISIINSFTVIARGHVIHSIYVLICLLIGVVVLLEGLKRVWIRKRIVVISSKCQRF